MLRSATAPTLRTLASPFGRTSSSRMIAATSHRPASSSASAVASTSKSSPPPPARAPAPQEPPSASASASAPSHFLVTLLRSPLHLAASQRATAASLGLHRRLSSSLVPVTAQNAGYLLTLKELVGVRHASSEDVDRWASKEWRERVGEGRRGSGMRVKQGASARSVIRIGSERARGDERGWRVVQ